MSKLTNEKWIGLGLCFGVALGFALNSLGVGVGLGLCLGAALGKHNADQESQKRDKAES